MDYRLEQFRFELREDPSSRIFFKLGEHLRREGEFDEAIEVLQTGLEQHSGYVAAWVSLGRAQLEKGDARGAQVALERALELDPENAVAARALGEAAIANGEWLPAVKALKRARGLSPQDDTLDERIAFVEARLDGLGLLEEQPLATEVRAPATLENGGSEAPEEEPFEVSATGDTGVWDDANDVFAAGWVDDPPVAEGVETSDVTIELPEDSEEYAPTPPPMTTDDIAAMVGSEDLVRTAEPTVVVHDEDSGVIESVEFEDVASPDLEADSEADAAFQLGDEVGSEPEMETGAAPETEPESDDGFERELDHDMALEAETISEVEAEQLPDTWPDPETELKKGDDGLPLPTMTLARLAIDQGDLDLAERTLRGVLEKEPDHSEAAELLETLIAGPPEEDPVPIPQDTVGAKTEALQRWLDAVRLASERLKT